MIGALVHRGPDDAGYWQDARGDIALGFRRLAILDLSAEGHQPMRSSSGRYMLVFNGEVYNHAELRRDLTARGARFRGHSDTEVILAAFESWGIERSVRRFIGMFAIAIWDTAERRLTLVRDRLGIKPLLFWPTLDGVAFASELKALLAVPGFERRIDHAALDAYLRYLYVPAPRTIFEGVRKVRPGELVEIDARQPAEPQSRLYWSLEDAATRGLADPFRGTPDEVVDVLHELLQDATRLRMRADVPVGAFLSGGIDSSSVVALMQSCSTRPVRTFAVSFGAVQHDEGPAAAAVADHLGTDHTEARLSAPDVFDLVPASADIFDEPFADPSMLPTYLISRVARQEVTVALSGDGGDEMLGGYNRYVEGERLLGTLGWVPKVGRRVMSGLLRAVPPAALETAATHALRLSRREIPRLLGDKVQKVVRLVGHDSDGAMYRSLLSQWEESPLLEPAAEDDSVLRVFAAHPERSRLDRMMLADQLEYLPDDLLAKVDRASMAVSLEVRVPLLDHRVAEFAWRLPPAFKIRDGDTKWILKQVLGRYVPRRLWDRPKVGFTVPVAEWLSGPLRGWAEDLLAPQAIEQTGLLRPDSVDRCWREFQAGHTRHALSLWAVLMFEAWHERWMKAPPSAILLGRSQRRISMDSNE